MMLVSMESKSMRKRWNHMKMKEIRKKTNSFRKRKSRSPKSSKGKNISKRRLKTKEMILSMTSSTILERSSCKIRRRM